MTAAAAAAEAAGRVLLLNYCFLSVVRLSALARSRVNANTTSAQKGLDSKSLFIIIIIMSAECRRSVVSCCAFAARIPHANRSVVNQNPPLAAASSYCFRLMMTLRFIKLPHNKM